MFKKNAGQSENSSSHECAFVVILKRTKGDVRRGERRKEKGERGKEKGERRKERRGRNASHVTSSGLVANCQEPKHCLPC